MSSQDAAPYEALAREVLGEITPADVANVPSTTATSSQH